MNCVIRNMEIVRGFHNLKPNAKGCVATIGNFDGVHLGHKMLLDRLFLKSSEFNAPSVLVTFEPQPREFLQVRKSQRVLAASEKR